MSGSRLPVGYSSVGPSLHDGNEFSSDLSATSLAFANIGEKSRAPLGWMPGCTAKNRAITRKERSMDTALIPFGFPHEHRKARNVHDSKVTALTPQQADRPQSAQLPGHRLAMRTDAVGNIREGWGRG